MGSFAEKLSEAGLLTAPPGSNFEDKVKAAGLDLDFSEPETQVDVSPTFREKLINAFGSTAQAGTNVATGTLSAVARSPLGAAVAAAENELSDALSPDGGTSEPVTQGDIVGALTNIQEGVAEAFPRDPRLEGDFLFDVLPGAAGSAAAFIGGGLAGRVVKLSAGLTAATVGALSNADASIRQAKGAGRSDRDVFFAGLVGLGTGASEGIPIGKAFQRLDDLAGGGVRRLIGKVAAGAAEEIVQETVQGIADNAKVRAFIDENQGLFDGVVSQGAAGGILGGVLNAITVGIGLRRGLRAERQAPVVPETPAESTLPTNTLAIPTPEGGTAEVDIGALAEVVQTDLVAPGTNFVLAPVIIDAEQRSNDAMPPEIPSVAGPPGSLGIIDPLGPRKPGKGRKALAGGRGSVFGLYAKPLIDVVGQQSGIVGEVTADMARKSVDATNRIRGRWSDLQHDLAGLVSGRFHPGRTIQIRRAMSELTQFVPSPDGRSFETVLQLAVEDTGFDPTAVAPSPSTALSGETAGIPERSQFKTLSPTAKEIVAKFRALTLEQGQTAAEMGVLIKVRDPETGKPMLVPFIPEPQGRKFMRAFTFEFFDIMRRGQDDSRFQALAETLASYPENNLDKPAALRELGEIGERANTRASSVEIARTFPRFPAWLQGGFDVIPVLYSHPMDVVTRASDRLAMRLGFISQFGQDQEGQVDQLKEQFQRNGGNGSDFDRMLRGLQGIPVHDPIVPEALSVGSPAHRVYRYARVLTGLAKVGRLTRAFVINTTELFGKVPAFGGGRRAVFGTSKELFRRGVMAGTRLLTRGDEGVVSYRRETMRLGARTVDVADWLINPARASESVARIAGNLFNAPLRAVNEFNEFFAAVQGIQMATDLKAGNGTLFDRQRLRHFLQFNAADVDAMIEGTASDELYGAVITRMAEATQGTTSLPAQRSFIGNSRIAKDAVAFDSYAQLTVDRTFRVLRGLEEEIIVAAKQGRLTKELGAQAVLTGEYFGGVAVQGSLALFVGAMVVDGLSGVREKKRDIEDDFHSFAVDALKNALISGQADVAVQAIFGNTIPDENLKDVRGARNAVHRLADSIFPISVFGDMADASMQLGSYAGTNGIIDAMSLFGQRNIALLPAMSQWAGIMGMSGKDAEMDLARRRFWGWMRQHTPSSRTEILTAEKISLRFRNSMHEAGRLIRDGKPPDEIIEVISQAVQAGTFSTPAQSLRGQKLIPKLPLKGGIRARFFNEFSPELRAKILQHDALLEAWAEALK